MSTENIVITVTETGSRQVARNIDSIGASAKKSQDSIAGMVKALNQINAAANALKSVESSVSKLNSTMARNAEIQARVDIAASRSALQQQKLATEVQRTQLAMAKVETQLVRTITAEDRAAVAAQNLARAQMGASTAAQKLVTEQQRTTKAAADAAAAQAKQATAIAATAAAQARAQNTIAAGMAAQAKAAQDLAAAQAKAASAVAGTNAAQARAASAATAAASAQASAQARASQAAAATAAAQARAASATAQAAGAADRAALSALKLEAAQRRAADAAARHSGSLDTLKGSLIAVAGALGIRSILDMADSWIAAEGKVNIFTHSATETSMVMDRLFEIAQKTRQPIDGIASSFHQLSIAGSALGASQNQLLQFTQAVGNALAIQGTDSNTARGGIIQLGQAMNEGIVRAQEYNSMINAMPIVLKTVANNLDGAGGSLAKLRQMMLAGKLTSKDFFEALLRGQGELEKLFDRSGKTFGQAFTVIQNGLKRYIGQMNEASGASRIFYDAAKLVAGNIDAIVKSMIALAAPRILLGMKAITMQLWAMAAAAAANPYVTLAAALISVVSALVLFKDQIVLAQVGMDDCSIAAVTLGDYMSGAWDMAKDGLSALVEMLKDPFMDAVNGIADAFPGIGEAFSVASQTVALNINTMIGTFMGFGKSIGIVLAGIAPAFRDAMVNAGNEMIGTLEGTINKAISLTNSMRDKVGLDPYENVQIGRIDNPDAGKAKELGSAVQEAFTTSVNFDYIGSATTAVGSALDELTERAKKNAVERQKLLNEDAKLRKEIDLDKPNSAGEDFAGNKKLTAAEKAADRARVSLGKWVAEQKAATDAANGMAAAYLEGGNAVDKYTRQQEIETEVAKRGEVARKAVTKAVNDHKDALDRLDLAKNIDDVRKQTADINAQTKIQLASNQSLDKGKAAQDSYTVSKALAVAMAGKNADGLSKESQELERQLTLLQEATNRQQATAEIAGLIESTANAQETYNRKLEHFKALQAYATTPEEIEAIRRATVKAQSETSIFAKITEGAVDRMDSAWADMWKGVFDGTRTTLEKMGDAIKQWLAEMAHMLLTKPLMVSIGNYLTGSQNSGGIGDVANQLLGGSSGSGGLGGLISGAKNALSIGTSNFGKSVMSGWASGDGIAGGIQNAFSNGADYVKSAITSGFSSGTSAAAEVASNFAASSAAGASQAGYTGAAFSNYVSSANAASNLSALSSTLSYVGAVYSVIQSFQAYGLKGGATTAGFAAAGAAIGSVVPVIGTALGAAIGAVVGSFGSSKLFGSGEKYPDQSTSATGRYINGQYEDTGIQQGWQTKAPKYGAAADAQMSSVVQKFSTTLGMLYDTIGNGADVVAYDLLQVRKTSGKYSTTFGAQLDDGSVLQNQQQFKADDIAAAMAANYDDVMGTFLAKAIVSSKSLPEYFKAQFTDFANSWDTTADEVIKAIEEVFQRFNGVNQALASINVAQLKMGDVGLQAADSILNMVASINGLDVATATTKEKIDSLNQSVQAYYSKFFSQAEQFSDLTKTLQNSFNGFGLNLPDTREGYRKIVESIDVTTGAGQAMFATFMGLATAADQYYSTIEDQAKTAADNAIKTAQDAATAIADANANYYDLFTTDAEKNADKLAEVRAEFQALGVELPATSKAFMEMVYAAEQGQVVGKATGGALKALATDASDAYKIIMAALGTAANDAFGVLQRSIDAQKESLGKLYDQQSTALQDSLDIANTSVSSLKDMANQLSDALKTMLDKSDEATKVLYDQGVATLQSAVAIAKAGGSLANFDGLDKALSAVTGNDESGYADWAKYARDQGVATNLISQLNDSANGQLTAADKNAKNLQDQLELLKKTYDSQIDGLDKQLSMAQAQLDVINGVNNSVKDVASAIAGLNASILAIIKTNTATTGPGSPSNATAGTNSSIVNSIYGELMGRDADASGLAAWTSALQSGASYAQIYEAIKASAATNHQLLPGKAMGGYASGLNIVGEQGPEAVDFSRGYVHNATNTRDLLAGSNDQVIELLQQVVEELQQVREYGKQSVQAGNKTVKNLQDIKEIGIPMTDSADA